MHAIASRFNHVVYFKLFKQADFLLAAHYLFFLYHKQNGWKTTCELLAGGCHRGSYLDHLFIRKSEHHCVSQHAHYIFSLFTIHRGSPENINLEVQMCKCVGGIGGSVHAVAAACTEASALLQDCFARTRSKATSPSYYTISVCHSVGSRKCYCAVGVSASWPLASRIHDVCTL